MQFAPIIKWSGSKRSQAEEIIARFPRTIDTYYEPFCGGCSVLHRLLNAPAISVKRYVVSDINADLIATWQEIKTNPNSLIEAYTTLWTQFNYGFEKDFLSSSEYRSALFAHRKEFFYAIRERLNKEHRPSDFLFLMRTCVNGMPRYNNSGFYNSPCHFSRPGIDPVKLGRICHRWSDLLNKNHVEFICCPYEEIVPERKNDLVYLDPPYFNTKGMYFGAIEFDKFFSWVGALPCKWALSFDGRTDKEDFTVEVPPDLYTTHEYLKSGNSSFRRVTGKDRHANVEESLYTNL